MCIYLYVLNFNVVLRLNNCTLSVVHVYTVSENHVVQWAVSQLVSIHVIKGGFLLIKEAIDSLERSTELHRVMILLIRFYLCINQIFIFFAN